MNNDDKNAILCKLSSLGSVQYYFENDGSINFSLTRDNKDYIDIGFYQDDTIAVYADIDGVDYLYDGDDFKEVWKILEKINV